jgi:hypothetical protein
MEGCAVSAWPNNQLARKALQLLRKRNHGDTLPIVWEFIHRMTKGKFARLGDLVCAELPEEEDRRRDELLTIICQALEAGDLALLES